MILVKIAEGIVDTYPYSINQLKLDYPNISFPETITEEVLASLSVYYVTSVQKPTYNVLTHRAVENNPALVDGVWTQAWEVVSLPPEDIEIQKQVLRMEYDGYLIGHLNATAQSRGYDDRISCALRAGFPGPYHTEGLAFATWMDNCNYQSFQMLQQVEVGQIPIPTREEFINSLPPMVWP
jgi:hypothetical protein